MTVDDDLRRRIRRSTVLLMLLALGVYGGYYLLAMWRNTG